MNNHQQIKMYLLSRQISDTYTKTIEGNVVAYNVMKITAGDLLFKTLKLLSKHYTIINRNNLRATRTKICAASCTNITWSHVIII